MKSNFKIILFILLSFYIASCVTSFKPPLPVTLNITPPSTDIPAELSAYVGIWEGKWGATQDTIIVIEKVDLEKAEIIISYGNLVNGVGFKPPLSYRYITANVLPGPRLEFYEATEPNPEACDKCDYVCPCKAIFELDKELNLLTVYWEYENYNSKIRADLKKKMM